MHIRMILVCLALTSVCPVAGHAGPPVQAPAHAQSAPMLPIRSARGLKRYLQTTPPGASPLDAFPPGGRKRFLASLKFGPNGLGGFRNDDLDHELTHAQAVRVLALFGLQSYARGIGLSPAQHARIEHERETAAKARGCRMNACPESEIERRYDRLGLANDDYSLPEAQLAAHIRHRYNRLFDALQTQREVHAASRPDLRLLKRAVEYVLPYAQTAPYIAQLRLDMAEMQRRGMTDDKDFTGLYRALVEDRKFMAAAALAKQHPGMDIAPLPTMGKHARLPPHEPTALTLAGNEKSMTRQAFDLTNRARIVVVASCHFSQDAARAIASDAKLGKLFARHAIWLADQATSIADAADWNRKFPDQPIHIAWHDSEWTMLDDWTMPAFYVFRHGKLVDHWDGWPAGSGMQTLRKHLRGDGLLPSQYR